MDASNTTWANLFPATNRTKLPAVAQKLDGDKFADNQTFFAVRAGQRVLDLGMRLGRKVGLAHLQATAKRSNSAPDFVGELNEPGSDKHYRVAAWWKPISQGNFAGRMYLRIALTPA